ncbi:MAG: translocation/assembly module TamB domain-containing protein [Acidobacteria bacterium]|nr:translocation/assembly module TamB domain-containing protein [Acidobacteriota bacterium]
MARAVRIAAWIAGGLLALLVFLVALLHTPPVRRFALKKGIEILEKQGVQFDASQFSYNLLALSATLDNVVVRSPQAPELPPLLEVDRVDVDLSLRDIIAGNYSIEDAHIRNPRLRIVVDKNGRDNIPRPPKKDTKSEAEYFADRLLIEGGSLRFEDRRQNMAAELPVSRVLVDGNPLTKNHEITFDTREGGLVSLETRTLPVRKLSASVLVEDNSADVRRLDITLGESTVALSGKIDNFEDPRFDVKANTTLALESLARFGGIKQNVGGNVNIALTATGPVSQLKARARIDGDKLTVQQIKNLDLKAEAMYDAAASRVRLQSLNAGSPLGAVRGSGDLALNRQAGQSTANISVRGLDLRRVTSAFDLPVRIASRAEANVAANWPALEFEKAAGDATVRLAATRTTPAQDVLPVSGSLNAKTQGSRMQVGIPGLRALHSTLQGQITIVNRQALGGVLRLQADDLSSTIAGAEAFLGRKPGTLAGTPVGGAVRLDAKLSGTIREPAVSAGLAAPALSVGDLKGVGLRASARYTADRLAIDESAITWQGQSVTAAGTVGLKGRDPAINLSASSTNIDIAAVLAGLNRKDIPASGQVQFNAAVSGTSKMPAADVRLTGTDLTAYNERLGSLRAQAQVQNQVVELAELRLEKPQPDGNGLLTASGRYSLDSKDYALEARTKNFRLTSLTLQDGTPVRGVLDLDAQGQGNVANPAANVRLAASGLQFGEQEIGNARLTAQVANQRAAIDAAVPKFNLTAAANIGTQKPYAATFEVKADGTNLESLPIKQPVKGTVTATVHGSGNLDHYEAGQAVAEVSSLNLEYNGQPVRTDGPLVARYESKRLTINRATLVALDSRLSVQGTLPLEPAAGEGEVQLTANLDLPSVARYLPATQPVTAQGTVVINGKVRGTLKRIDPNVTVALTNASFATPQMPYPVTNANLRAEIRNGTLDLQSAGASYGPATLTAAGTVPFGLLPANLPVELPRAQGPARLTAELRELDIGALEGVPRNVSGRVSARLEAGAPKADLDSITGTLAFPQLQVKIGTYALEQKGTSEIRIANGTARVTNFGLTGPATDIRLAGTAGLTGARALDLRLDGKLDASILSVFAEDLRAQGDTTIEVAVSGNAQQPQARGFVQLAGAQFSMRDPLVAADDLNVRIDLAGTRATISQLGGELNGGKLSGGGALEYAGGHLRNTNLNIKAEGVYLDFPAELKTVSDVNLQIASQPDQTVAVGGEVVIQEGGFTQDLHIGTGLLARLNQPREINLTEERNPLVESIRFNLPVRTAAPLIIDNNYAKAEVEADLRLLGTPYQPGLAGRLVISEGGEIRLQERRYAVERGIITFTNDRRIEPSLDILATTSVQGYDVRLQVTGEPGDTKTTLTSDPALPEPDILALLLTGKTMDEMRGQEFEVAQNQVLSYLAGSVGARLGSSIAGATGLSTVRLEPSLIAAEENPGARLTIGQDITRNLELIYSMNLINSSDQIYIAEYDVTRRFSTRGTRQSDGSFRFDLRHDLRFGGIPEPRRGRKSEQRRIGNVRIIGEKYFSEMKIEEKFKVKEGNRYDFFKVRKGMDRVGRMYAKANLLESRVRLQHQENPQTVDLALNVQSGPVVDLVYEGVPVPGKVRDRVRDIWQSGVFDAQRVEEAKDAIRNWLVKEDHLQAKIEHSITQLGSDRKRVLFDVQPGPKFRQVEIVFDGAQGIEPGRLRGAIDDQKLEGAVYTDPDRVTDLLTRYYKEYGYLDAEVERPRYELNAQAGTGKVVFPVKEGPLFRVGKVNFEGNAVFPDERLAEAAPMPAGEPYRPVLPKHAIDRLQQLYWEGGYNDVEIEYSIARSAETGAADVTFRIAENRRAVVRDIVVEGRDHTSENMIRTQLEFNTGDTLDLRKLARSRRNLYNTGAYSLVDITREEISGEAAAQTRARRDDGPAEKPVRLRVRVREVQPYEIRYGGFFDTERGPGGIVDIANRNSLGSARVLGLRARYDRQLREGRLYFTQPELRRFPFRTIISPYIRMERHPATELVDPFNVDRTGLSFQQESHFRRYYIFNYGYNIERSKTWDPLSDVGFEDTVRLRIASLTSTFSRESRDEILDATRGSFLSHAVQFSPEVLGSQVRFLKYFGQFFKYFPLQEPRIELFTNEVHRPRLVYATGVRMGLARGFGGQELPLAERFFAGGSTTVRGFEQNSIGPLLGREPLGGQAMLVLNNELRFPVVSIFDGVGFVDIGNVYPTVSDLSLGELRKSAGLGVRVRTPWFLLRLDYGFKLDRRPEESRGRFFFSIGQAF